VGSILFWVGALVVVSLLSPLLKIVIAALAGKQIGAAALAKQPDNIRLQRGGTWKNAAAPGKIVAALTSRGFEDAGAYTIAEMPGMVVQLLADAANGLYAAIYEHPQVGSWLELFSRFQDGTSVTYSTSRATALRPRPGHPNINMPGAEPSAVLDKALTMRPRRPLEDVSAAKAVAVFERAYAEGIAYRKQVGISTGEVVRTAARKAA
jgi:hypothetical protein